MKVSLTSAGTIIIFGTSEIEMQMALETLYMVRDVTGTEALDRVIVAMHNFMAPPPPVSPICELCWTPIDRRIHEMHQVDGKFTHAKCPTKN